MRFIITKTDMTKILRKASFFCGNNPKMTLTVKQSF